MPVEILPDDPAVAPAIVAIVVGVAAITGAVIVAVIVAVARANADAHADRTRADPNALRVCRQRQGNASRRQKSDCKLPHVNLHFAAPEKNAHGRAHVPKKLATIVPNSAKWFPASTEN